MHLLQLAQQIGLQPKKLSSTHGGEYHSACPNCGGKDRFILWPTSGRYWCRRCNISGDFKKFSLQFLNAFYPKFDKPRFSFQREHSISRNTWNEKATSFASSAHSHLMCDFEAMQHILDRGLKKESMYRFKIGWNPNNRFDELHKWGFEPLENKKVWLPRGDSSSDIL